MKQLIVIIFVFLYNQMFAQKIEKTFIEALKTIENSNSTDKSKERGIALATYLDQKKEALGGLQAIKNDAAALIKNFIEYDSYAAMYTLLRIRNIEDAKMLRDLLSPSQKDLMVKALMYHSQNYQNGSVYPGLAPKGTGTIGNWHTYFSRIVPNTPAKTTAKTSTVSTAETKTTASTQPTNNT